MKFLRNIIRAVCNYFIYPLSRIGMYLLSFLVPRRKNLWAFGGPDDMFADNTKYFYLWVSANRPDIQAVWLTSREAVYRELVTRGYRAAYRWSINGILTAIRAKFHIFHHYADDVHFPFSGGSFHVNLWHGVGIKNIQYATKVGRTAKTFAGKWNPLIRLPHWASFRAPDVFLATSPMMAQHFARCFRIPVGNCPQIGYPRLDVATDEDLRQRALAFGNYSAVDAAFADYDEVYLYMPTWRDSGHDFMAEALPDLATLSQALATRHGLLYIKAHPNTLITLSSRFDNIRIWPSGLDIYPLLASFDVLITDYSSVLYDYLFFKDRGVILYLFDYDDYITKEHDLAFPFADNIIGLQAQTFDKLCNAIKSGAGLAQLPSGKLAELREHFWGDTTGLSSPKLANYLEKLSKHATG